MTVGGGWASRLTEMLGKELERHYGDRRKTFDVWDEKTQRIRRVKKPWGRTVPLFKESR